MPVSRVELESFSTLVGDLELASLSVEFKPERRLVLGLEQGRSRGSPDRTVTFSGLAAFEFSQGGPPTILFDIVVASTPAVVRANPEWEVKAQRFGWPVPTSGATSLMEALGARSLTAFELHSSAGLEGVIFAETMRICTVTETGCTVEAEWPSRSSTF